LSRNGSPEPEFITDEDRVQFITRIMIHKDFKKVQVSDQVRILEFCKIERPIIEIMNLLNLKHRTYFRNSILKNLILEGLLELTIPNKPNSPKQKYKITKKGLKELK